MPPRSMIGPSRVFSRYYYESDGNKKYFNPLDKSTPITTLPRYCTIHQSSDGTAELRPNLSKKTRRLRKPPGAVPVAQALVSTLSHSSGKYNDYNPTQSEVADNQYVVKLIEACLCWNPEKRISPDEAKAFSWFNYRSKPTSQHTRPISLLMKSSNSPRVPTGKVHRTTSQVQLVNESLTTRKVSAPVAPNAAAASSMPIVAPVAIPMVAAVPMPVVTAPDVPKLVTTVTVPQPPVAVNGRKKATILPPTESQPAATTTAVRHSRGSPASISSGENKQEERVIYARPNKSTTPKALIFERSTTINYTGSSHNIAMEKKMSDVSLASMGSSIDDSGSRQGDNSRYTRRHGHGTERFQESNIRTRKRNQSVEPKRHTQPVGGEVITKDRTSKPSKGLVTCKTATISSSPDDDSQTSGRQNPNGISKASNLDLSSSAHLYRSRKHSTPDDSDRSSVGTTRTRPPIAYKSEMLTPERRFALTKTMSAVDFHNQSSSLSKNSSDDSSDVSTKRYGAGGTDVTPVSVLRRKHHLKELAFEPKISDPGPKLTPQQTRELQFSKLPTTRQTRVRDGTSKVLQPHTDYRRRQVPKKSASISHLGDLGNQKAMLNSSNDPAKQNGHNGRVNPPLRVESEVFLDINPGPPAIMMIKPQN